MTRPLNAKQLQRVSIVQSLESCALVAAWLYSSLQAGLSQLLLGAPVFLGSHCKELLAAANSRYCTSSKLQANSWSANTQLNPIVWHATLHDTQAAQLQPQDQWPACQSIARKNLFSDSISRSVLILSSVAEHCCH